MICFLLLHIEMGARCVWISLNFILFVQITHIHTNTFHGYILDVGGLLCGVYKGYFAPF